MIKKAKLSYAGMNKDISFSKRDGKFYFDATNIRILATENNTTGSLSNEKGNLQYFALPTGQEIIGHATIKDYLVLFSTNGSGTDKITRIDLNHLPILSLPSIYQVEIFSGLLNFSLTSLIETDCYYESEDIQKVYWVDGLNQLRHINIVNTYTQNDAVLFDAVPEVSFSAPYINSIDYGGIHTSGMIQYAYNLVKLNGSQSNPSPMSELYPLNKVNGGGKVNEVVGKILNIKIDSIDTRYDIIRLYSIKYTSYNEQPAINLIAEETIGGNTSFVFSDDGRIITTITPSEFLFLGGIPIIASTINSKYNRLLLGNIKEIYFDVNTTTYDTRAYRFPISTALSRIENANIGGYTEISWDGTKIVDNILGGVIPQTHDCISSNFSTYNYQRNSSIIGASGTNIDVSIVQRNETQIGVSNLRNLLKSNEIYRIGIEFYNKLGQFSSPKWICDIKVPSGNLNDNYNTLSVVLRNTTSLTSQGVVGWRVLRVDRTDSDKTVLCQGIINPSIFQDYINKTTAYNTIGYGTTAADNSLLKVPSMLMRNRGMITEYVGKMHASGGGYYGTSDTIQFNEILHGKPITNPLTGGGGEWPFPEILKVGDNSTHNTYEETRLFQLYSPELIFAQANFSDGMTYSVIKKLNNSIADSGEWCKQYSTEDSFKYKVVNGELKNEVKVFGKISLYKTSKDRGAIQGKAEPNQNGIFGPGGGETKRINKYHYWRKYLVDSGNVTAIVNNILGEPTQVGTGESSSIYKASNVSNKYKFSNNLYSIISDPNPGDLTGTKSGSADQIVSINSLGIACLNIVDEWERPLETILNTCGITTASTTSTGLIEIYRSITNQYGGNTYEARSRNNYIRIGRYKLIGDTTNQIDQAGDTFVAPFRFERIIPNPTQIENSKYISLCETVEFPVETSIDLLNRSDYSNDGLEGNFQPTFDEYHNYNRVYSQQPIFNMTTATPFMFIERKHFENRILATKVKVTGELVDSWTDVQLNEELYVDGNFGKIVKIIKNNDLMACFQEQAISILAIQPRIQTVGSDGYNIELGRGAVFYDYKYITITSGGTNKNCIFKSPSSIYYIDVINKTINRISANGLEGLSDTHGFHSYMYDAVSDLLKDNQVVNGVFDQITNDAYFTTGTFTLAFNEQSASFTSFYNFIPKRYISTFKGLISTLNGTTGWMHGKGDYCKYYDTIYESNITFLAAPEPDEDCVFNNLEFKSEVYANGVDVPDQTIDKIKVWNDYQTTAEINLNVGGNIRRKYRDWNLFIPRSSTNAMHRIRGPFAFIKLWYHNNANNRLVLHDVDLSYDAIYKR